MILPVIEFPPNTGTVFQVHSSAEFPLNLADEVRVAAVDQVNSHYPYTEHPVPDLAVARITNAGFEPVGFSLVEDPHYHRVVRKLILDDPAPGRYIVASASHTYAGDPSPFDEGTLIAEYEMTRQVDVPTHLGTVEWHGQTHPSITVGPVGDDPSCATVQTEAIMSRNSFSLQLSPEAMPWRRMLAGAIFIDGRRFSSEVPSRADDTGQYSFDIYDLCSGGSADVAPRRLADGPHELKMVALIRTLDVTIESTTATFDFSCPDLSPIDEMDDTSRSSNGCSITAHQTARPTATLLGACLALCALIAVRRRSRA